MSALGVSKAKDETTGGKGVYTTETTYRFGNRSFIVEPVFKEETQNTLDCVLLRLMKSESAGA